MVFKLQSGHDFVTDRRMYVCTDRRRDDPCKTICLPTLKGGDIIKGQSIYSISFKTDLDQLENLQFLKINRYKYRLKTTASAMKGQSADQPKKKAFFSRSLLEQKFSNANFRGENSARFRVSSRRPCFLREISRSDSAKRRRETPRTFGEFLREISRRYSAKTRSHLKNVNNLNFCFVWFVVLRPSQQLWSCRGGQLT